jgi:hypothetical protein
MDAPAPHTTMSKQALDSERVKPWLDPYLGQSYFICACHEGGLIDQAFDWPGKPHSAGITTALRGSAR